MNITIENNKVVVNLEPDEFAKFQAMFANLNAMKNVSVEYREFPGYNGTAPVQILPMHLCRTIGEANLGDDPFATVSLYPFWKHGFAFGNGASLAINPQVEDPHKKAVFSDEIACGCTAFVMEALFHCVEWADTSALLKAGAIFSAGSKKPDYVCTLPDGTLGIFEAKGTTGGSINPALAEGKIQTAGITAPVQIKHRVVVGAILGETTKIILLDPQPDDSVGARHAVPVQTNLTPEMVAKAAKAMRLTPRPSDTPLDKGGMGGVPLIKGETPRTRGGGLIETLFRGPDGEIKLTNEFKEDKRHNWLEVR
jgi:hypothetical protein